MERGKIKEREKHKQKDGETRSARASERLKREKTKVRGCGRTARLVSLAARICFREFNSCVAALYANISYRYTRLA